MGRHGVAAVFFLFLIVADVSSAASKIGKLGDEAGSDIPASKEAVPLPPNPVTGLKEPDLKVDNLGKSGNGAAVLDPKASGNTGSAIAPPQSTTESGKVIDVSGKRDSANSPPKTLADSGKDKASYGGVETGKDNQAKEGEGKKNNDTDEKGILKDNQTKEGEGKKKNGTDNGPEGVQINEGKGKKQNGTDNGPEGVQINEGKGKKENEGDDKSGPKDEQKKEGDDKKKNAGDGNSGLPEKEIDKGEVKKKKGGDDKSGLPDKDKNEGHEKEKNEGGDKSGSQDEKKENQGDDKSGSEDKQVKEGDDKKKTDDISGSQDKQKKEEEAKQKNDNDDKSASQSFSSGTCNGVPRRCTDQNHLIACIKGVAGSKELVVLVENEGEGTLKVKLEVSTSMEYPLKELNVPKHETKGINISATSIQNGKLILTAGHGDCVLHMDLPGSSGTFFNLPEYDKLLTPINGAYFLIATVVIFAATWACCKFRKRKRHLDGVPYQELEMGRPETISDATGIETADSWDQVWDDDWDEEHAVKSPTVRHLGNISANGLTARSANKDGWENDWDD